MGKYKISVVTVCFNAEKEIENTILSVVDQTYDDIEYLVIDGGSSDGTVDIIKKYVDGGSEAMRHRHHITYWVSEPDKGIYDAMNKGIIKATGDYINFMNAGDSFYNDDVIEKVVNKIEQDTIIVYGQLIKKYNRFEFIACPQAIDLDMMKNSARLPHQSMFACAPYIKDHKFSLSYKSASDFKFYYEAHFQDKCKFQYIPFIIANYDSEKGMSKDSYIGPLESLKIQGKKISTLERRKLIIKYKLINLLKKYLPESIITKIRINKFSKQGYEIMPK